MAPSRRMPANARRWQRAVRRGADRPRPGGKQRHRRLKLNNVGRRALLAQAKVDPEPVELVAPPLDGLQAHVPQVRGRVHGAHVRGGQRDAADMLAAIASKDYEDRPRRQAQRIDKAKAEGRMKGRPENEKRIARSWPCSERGRAGPLSFWPLAALAPPWRSWQSGCPGLRPSPGKGLLARAWRRMPRSLPSQGSTACDHAVADILGTQMPKTSSLRFRCGRAATPS